MQINGLGNIDPLRRSNGQNRAGKAYENANADASKTSSKQAKDEVELSGEARFISKLSQIPDVRSEVVEKARASLAAGEYESGEKLENGIKNLLEEL